MSRDVRRLTESTTDNIIGQLLKHKDISYSERLWLKARIRKPLEEAIRSESLQTGYEERLSHDYWEHLHNLEARQDMLEDRLDDLQSQINKVIHSGKEEQEPIDPELEWISRNAAIIESYEGKYIAIKDGRILAVGETSNEAFTKAKEKEPHTEPTIMLVPRKGLSLG